MGKKMPLMISTLTFLAGGLASTGVSAVEYSPTAWTYDEMAAFNAEVEPEIDAYCGDDPMCRNSYLYEKSEDIYRALSHYREHGLTITAINPYNHTIRISYNPDVISFNPSQKPTIRSLYFVQGEEGYYAGNYVTDIENHNEAGLEHAHILFVERDISDSETRFPDRTEIELAVPELAIFDDRQKTIEVTYQTLNPNSSWADRFYFTDCLASLEEGMECRIMYGPNNFYYAPVKIEQSNNPRSQAAENSDFSTTGQGNITLSSSVQPSNPTDNPGATPVTAPNTGAPTKEMREEATEFPWWLGIIFVTGLAALAWLFWPRKQKKM